MNRAIALGVAGVVLLAVAVGAVALGGLLADEGGFDEEWAAESPSSFDTNHHRGAVASTDRGPLVAVPVNGPAETNECQVTAFDGDGGSQWVDQLPPEHCHAHAVGDLTATSLGGEPALLVGTGEAELVAYDTDGEGRFVHDLDEFGYSPPAVADLTGDGREEIVAIDFFGGVVSLDTEGEPRWEDDLDARVWASPLAIETSDDTGVAVAFGEVGEYGGVTRYDATGDRTWTYETERPVLSLDSTTLGGEDAVVLGSRGGSVAVLDAAGDDHWTIDVDARSAVATDDEHVYVADDNGTIQARAVEDGSLVWERTLSEAPAGTPHPVVGALDGAEQLVVGTTSGDILAFDPQDGDLLDSHQIDAELYATPTPADVTGDGTDELVVVDGTARTTVLAYD